jgi:hypothetical protein
MSVGASPITCKLSVGVVEGIISHANGGFLMTLSSTPDSEEQLFVEAARTSYRRLKQWERQHPTATLGEIEQKTREERRLLMAQLIPLLLADRRRDDPQTRPRCPECGKRMPFQDDGSVPVETLEGRITLERPYYYCRSCHEGLFPPRSGSASDRSDE